MGGTSSTDSPLKTATTGHHNNNIGDIVIIPVDQSKQAEAAFEWYVKHVHKPDNVVRVVHCQELLQTHKLPDFKGKESETIQDQLFKSRENGRSLIDKYEGKLEQHQIRGSVHSDFATSAGEMVMQSVDKYHGTMVVMGTRGFGIVRRTILGSVSHFVITHSQVPVTVVPPEVQSRFF